ncbi:hypothetical protein FHX80_113400 [Streptomyces brevispora]|uniref:Uncharacterized protein n=1 Tax=Streptomyces brevispora TaxID=887462 RepID=A0A561UZY4_9ACTN|nr:hypothetical protein FHX80_113400 [Streptomyces brevispora]
MTWTTCALVCRRTLPPTGSAAPNTDSGADTARMVSCSGRAVSSVQFETVR